MLGACLKSKVQIEKKCDTQDWPTLTVNYGKHLIRACYYTTYKWVESGFELYKINSLTEAISSL